MAYTYMIQHARVRGNAIDKDTMTEARAGWLAREARCPRFARFRESRVASKDILMVSFPTVRFLLFSTWTTEWFPIT